MLPGGAEAGVRPIDPTLLERVVYPFPVTDAAGRVFDHPLLGGLEIPRVQFADIDADGDPDLFVQERTGELMYFENVGGPATPSFLWRTDRLEGAEPGEWSRFVDVDGDGDLDLLSEEPFSYIRYQENRGTPERHEFVLVEDSIRYPDGTAIFSDRQNIPFFVDLDCNGALDLFLGRIDGTLTRLEEWEPTSPGNAPVFGFLTDRFEEIEIVAQVGTALHGANSVVFTDFDEDGDPDILWGDFFEPGLLLIENIGSCSRPNFRVEPVQIPSVDSVGTSGYNASALADLDGDGTEELFIGVLGGAYNPLQNAVENFFMYRKEEDGRVRLETSRFLYTIDVGSESIPAAGDMDGDGDLDLLLGSKIEPDHITTGRLFYFENVGTQTAPAYALVDSLELAETFHYAPTLGDLDGDGTLDLLLGNWRATLAYWRNVGVAEGGGTGTGPFTLVDSAVVELPRGSNTVPALGDLDRDGDLDLLVGEAGGTLNYFRNDGTPNEPEFVLVDEEFQGIDVGRRSAPSLVDVDADGDLDLAVGSEEGGLRLYRNTSVGAELRFEEDPSFGLPLFPHSAPAWADLDGDGDLDLLAGSIRGGISVHLNGG